MAISEAQQRAVQKYVAKNYDRIGLTLPKGEKDRIKAAASARNQSVNAYIAACINEAERGAGGAPPAAQDAGQEGGYLLPSEVLTVALSATERTGESIDAFLYRAVTTQAQRDENSAKLGIKPGQ